MSADDLAAVRKAMPIPLHSDRAFTNYEAGRAALHRLAARLENLRFCPYCAHGYEWQEGDPAEGPCAGCCRAEVAEAHAKDMENRLGAMERQDSGYRKFLEAAEVKLREAERDRDNATDRANASDLMREKWQARSETAETREAALRVALQDERTSKRRMLRRALDLKKSKAALRETLAEWHERVCGCDEPGRTARCVAGPECAALAEKPGATEEAG